MLSKTELSRLIAAWPDENGNSTDPDALRRWDDRQNQYLSEQVFQALGKVRIDALSARQKRFLNCALERLKDRKSVFEITEQEILGQYELVTEYLAPIELEVAVKKHKRRHKFQ